MNIVILDGATLGGDGIGWAPIEELGSATCFDRTPPGEIISQCRNAEIVVTNKAVIDREVIGSLSRLKFIAVTATGFNVVDIDAARERNIPVSNVPEYSTAAVAQHVFAMLLSFIHRPEQHSQAVDDGDWCRSNDFSFWLNPICELAGKTLGIVGYGRIGQATARIGQSFGMKIIVHSRTPRTIEGLNPVSWVSLDQLAEASDVISLHCPQTDANLGFVDRQFLGLMKRNAILINTARGQLVNEVDLAQALTAGQIGGACLDVVATEPMSASNPLIGIENCLITPHLAWSATEARQRLMAATKANIEAFLAGAPTNVVNL